MHAASASCESCSSTHEPVDDPNILHMSREGTVNRRGYSGQQKGTIVMLVDCVHRFEAYWSQFFAKFDWFIVLMSRLDA